MAVAAADFAPGYLPGDAGQAVAVPGERGHGVAFVPDVIELEDQGVLQPAVGTGAVRQVVVDELDVAALLRILEYGLGTSRRRHCARLAVRRR